MPVPAPSPIAVYISQTLHFKAPVKIGKVVMASVTVAEIIPERRRVRLTCQCCVGETVVLEGEAIVKVPARPAPAA